MTISYRWLFTLFFCTALFGFSANVQASECKLVVLAAWGNSPERVSNTCDNNLCPLTWGKEMCGDGAKDRTNTNNSHYGKCYLSDMWRECKKDWDPTINPQELNICEPPYNSDDPACKPTETAPTQCTDDTRVYRVVSGDKDFYALYNQKTESERINAYFKIFNPSNHDSQAVIAVNKYINGKVKLGLNNGRYLRVEEAILNLAEAQYLSGDQGAALITLNKLRDVRYSNYTGGETGTAIFDAIQLERRKELAFENGDRWFTLKRLQGVAGISPVYTSGIQRSGNGYLANGTGTASSEQTLKAGDHKWQLPIPQSVLNLNKNMTQTPGY